MWWRAGRKYRCAMVRILLALGVSSFTSLALHLPAPLRSRFPRGTKVFSGSPPSWGNELGINGGSWGGHSAPNDFLSSNDFSSPAMPASTGDEALLENVESPLKTMVFIDGTWLYYSLYGQESSRCAVTKVYGTNWQQRYAINWAMLPRLIARSIEQELREKIRVKRHAEVVKTVVFTSAKASTPAHSQRIRMFRDMQRANFEVHMSTTEGEREKTVDIALAVEMLHYATTPGACDVCCLVTGDKDFMPAMTRTRQRGKRVAIATMRNNCARDLVAAQSHVRDFDPVMLEKFLPELLVPISPSSLGLRPLPPLSGGGRSSSVGGSGGGSVVGGGSGGESPSVSSPHQLEAELLQAIFQVMTKQHEEHTTSSGAGSDGDGGGSAVMEITAKYLGRGLKDKRVAVPSSDSLFDGRINDTVYAVVALKEFFGGLKRFLCRYPHTFSIAAPLDPDGEDRHNFRVSITADAMAAAAGSIAAGGGISSGGGGVGVSGGGVVSGRRHGDRGTVGPTRAPVTTAAPSAVLLGGGSSSSSTEDELEEEEEEEEEEEDEEEDDDDDEEEEDDDGGLEEEGYGSLAVEDLQILDDQIVTQMLVPEIKEWLRALGLPRTGRKADLVLRLKEAIDEARSARQKSGKLAAMEEDELGPEHEDDDDEHGEHEEEEGDEGKDMRGDLDEDLEEVEGGYESAGSSESGGGTSSSPSPSPSSAPPVKKRQRAMTELEEEVVSLVRAAVLESGQPYKEHELEAWGNAQAAATSTAATAAAATAAGGEGEGPQQPQQFMVGSRIVGRALKSAPLSTFGNVAALESVKALYGSLAAFLRLFPEDFALVDLEEVSKEFGIVVIS